jgi:hypothetical protein
MTSILENEYVEPNRPYSQKELVDRRERLYRNFRLGDRIARHQRSGYFYRVRVNGRKEREMIETESDDVGNCSVSWKLSKTPNHLRDLALDLVENYSECFEREPSVLTYRLVEIEDRFYKWLYEDQEHRRRVPRGNFNSS